MALRILLLAFALILGACSATPERSTHNPEISRKLQAQLSSWRGTPYRMGGNSRQGIDCSAFVQQTFASQFNKGLPRTTKQQADIGNRVGREALRPGDLVFFKTGWRSRHVGIYSDNGYFIHASKSQGVTRSSLDNAYWRKHYWQARRIAL